MYNYFYDDILLFSDSDYTIAIQNNKVGLISSLSGEPITEFIYDDLTKYYDGIWQFIYENFIPLRLNNKWGVINTKGETVLDFVFENKIKYIDGLIYTKQNKKFGVLDKNFNSVIPFEYDKLGYFENNYCKACKIGKWGIIDRQNNVIIDFLYDEIIFCKNFLIIKKNEKYGICDFNGKILQKPIYESHNYRKWQNSVLTQFYTKHKVNYIDENGIIQKSLCFPKYTVEEELNDNLFLIRKNNRFGVVNANSCVLLEPKYNRISQFGELFVIDNEYIYGCKKSVFMFDNIYPYSDKYAIISKNGKDGVIDVNADIIIEPEYSWLDLPPNSKYIVAFKDSEFGVIDLQGNIIVDFGYANINICSSKEKEVLILQNIYGETLLKVL